MCKALNWNCSYFVAVCPFKLEHFKISAIYYCGYFVAMYGVSIRMPIVFAGQTFANSMYLYIREISMEINTNVHRRQLDIISWGSGFHLQMGVLSSGKFVNICIPRYAFWYI